MKKFLNPFFRILVVGAIVLSLPHFAMALVMDDYLLFGVGAVTLDSSSNIGGNVYSGGAINVTGATFTHADYVGAKTGTPASGSTLQIPSLGAIEVNSVILGDISGLGFTYTTIAGAHTFNSEAAGVYYVTGAVTFAAGATGNWTIITDGAINGAGSGNITGFIPADSLFPNGLALYGGGALSGFTNDITGAVVVAGAIRDANFDIEGSSTGVSAVPEPATMLLLGFGLMGLAGVRRKFKN